MRSRHDSRRGRGTSRCCRRCHRGGRTNWHASTGRGASTLRDVALARATAMRWAGDAPLVLGGDFNVEQPAMPSFAHAGGSRIDHVYARGLAPVGPVVVLDRGALSDHAPLLVTIDPSSALSRT